MPGSRDRGSVKPTGTSAWSRRRLQTVRDGLTARHRGVVTGHRCTFNPSALSQHRHAQSAQTIRDGLAASPGTTGRNRAVPAIRRPQQVASDPARARAHPPQPEEHLPKGLNRPASADLLSPSESASASSAGAPPKWTQSVGPSNSHETQRKHQHIRRSRRHAAGPGRADFPKARSQTPKKPAGPRRAPPGSGPSRSRDPAGPALAKPLLCPGGPALPGGTTRLPPGGQSATLVLEI